MVNGVEAYPATGFTVVAAVPAQLVHDEATLDALCKAMGSREQVLGAILEIQGIQAAHAAAAQASSAKNSEKRGNYQGEDAGIPSFPRPEIDYAPAYDRFLAGNPEVVLIGGPQSAWSEGSPLPPTQNIGFHFGTPLSQEDIELFQMVGAGIVRSSIHPDLDRPIGGFNGATHSNSAALKRLKNSAGGGDRAIGGGIISNPRTLPSGQWTPDRENKQQ